MLWLGGVLELPSETLSGLWGEKAFVNACVSHSSEVKDMCVDAHMVEVLDRFTLQSEVN